MAQRSLILISNFVKIQFQLSLINWVQTYVTTFRHIANLVVTTLTSRNKNGFFRTSFIPSQFSYEAQPQLPKHTCK